MMTLIAAALAAAQPAPPASTHGQMAGMEQGAKDDCCKDGCKCCDDTDAKHGGHAGEHGGHAQ